MNRERTGDGEQPVHRDQPGQKRSRGSSFSVPGYLFIWVTGWLWHVARWMAVFVSTFRINELTGDPLLVQLVGSAFFAPMFFGGFLAGTISDRFDRRTTVGRALGFLIPLSGLMGLVVIGDRGGLPLIYLFILAVGVGNVIDMTSRRTLAFGLVGAGLLTNAAALESLALQGGNMAGQVMGGAILETFNAGALYLMIGVVYLVALSTFMVGNKRARAAAHESIADPGPDRAESSLRDDLFGAVRLLKTNERLRRFLVITVVMNFFYFAFIPLIPVFAERLGVGAFLTGVLGAASGLGTVTGASLIAYFQPARRGLIHIVGSLFAMVMLVTFANLRSFPLAVIALYLAGVGAAGFGATQAALVISLATESVRGRAMGALSMAIGAVPFGMFSLGLLARRTDPVMAVTISVSIGFVLLVGWQALRPEIRAL